MISFGEKLLRKYLKWCFPQEVVKYNFREADIINPNTGKQLELDIYYPKIKVAFEFNGRQHKTDLEQKERDKIKRKECKKKGILLITIWTKDLKHDMYKEIKNKVFDHSGYIISKPNKNTLETFYLAFHEYRTSISKLHRSVKSDKFVKRRR